MARSATPITPASQPPGPDDTPLPAEERGAPSHWAISRGALLALMAVLLPAATSLLAGIFTEDIAYHLRSGATMLDSGRVLDRDLFTFTMEGQPWLDQQWAASVIFTLVHDASGWLGLLLLRAVLIGAAFGLVYVACRGTGASRMVASLVTLGSFVVAATNLALRAQLFGLLWFAALLAILTWRRRHPWLLLIVPLLMVAWANTHGSFIVGWAALGVAVLDDLLARRRLAWVTLTIGILSVLATVLTPWGVELWTYVAELSSSPLIAALVTEWQAPTLETATGIFFFASVAIVVGLLLHRGRVISWVSVLWLAGLVVLALRAARNVIWWAIGAAPATAELVDGLTIRGRRVGDPALDDARGVGYTAIAGLLIVLMLAVVPFYRPSDPVYGPEGVLQHAPRQVTEALQSAAGPADRLFAIQQWGSWFEYALPQVPVMVDSRIELFDAAVWSDYLAVLSGRADWVEILDGWGVTLVAIGADDVLRPFIGSDPAWELLHEDEEGVVFRRTS